MVTPVIVVVVRTRVAWNWFTAWGVGWGNEPTKAKIDAKSVTVSARIKIVAMTSETPRRERFPHRVVRRGRL